MTENAEFPQELAELIPDRREFDDYVSRKFGDIADLDIIHMAAGVRHNVLIFGPTGPGKTSAVLAYAARENLPFYSIPCNGAIEPRDFFGANLAHRRLKGWVGMAGRSSDRNRSIWRGSAAG